MLKRFYLFFIQSILAACLMAGCQGSKNPSNNLDSKTHQALPLERSMDSFFLKAKTKNQNSPGPFASATGNKPLPLEDVKKNDLRVQADSLDNNQQRIEYYKLEKSNPSASSDQTSAQTAQTLSNTNNSYNSISSSTLNNSQDENQVPLENIAYSDSHKLNVTDVQPPNPLESNQKPSDSYFNSIDLHKNDLGVNPIQALPNILGKTNKFPEAQKGGLPDQTVVGRNNPPAGTLDGSSSQQLPLKATPSEGTTLVLNHNAGGGILSGGTSPRSITIPIFLVGPSEGRFVATDTPSGGTVNSSPSSSIIGGINCLNVSFNLKFVGENSSSDGPVQLPLSNLDSNSGNFPDALISFDCEGPLSRGFVRVIYFDQFPDLKTHPLPDGNQSFANPNQSDEFWKHVGGTAQYWDIPLKSNTVSLKEVGTIQTNGLYLFQLNLSAQPLGEATPVKLEGDGLKSLQSELNHFNFLRAVQVTS